VPAFSLTPEWEFLYLPIHATDHAWRSLRWLVDIHQIASCGLVDWQNVMEKADEFEIVPAIRETLAVLASPGNAAAGTLFSGPPACGSTTLPLHECSCGRC
jgi:hypothetical protein